jgi:hypothetical protein
LEGEYNMRKRFSLRALAGLTALAAAVVVALMVAGSGAATSAGFVTGGTYTSIAGTDLHSSQVGSDSTTFTQDCSDFTPTNGDVLWHFVLVQTTAVNAGTLRAEFQNAGVTTPDVVYSKHVGGVLHWDVITPSSDVLLAASTDAVGGILNLSHVCDGSGSGGGGETSTISTTVHRGATDSGTPTVVDETNPAVLGSTVHDSANLTFTGGGTLPTGSTVFFGFFHNDSCSDDVADLVGVDVGGQSSPAGGLDPALVEGPLPAGSYSYIAVFVSGDSSKVADALGECEPFTISQGSSSTSTSIHLGATDGLGGPVVVTSVLTGRSVHDSATVTGTPPAFTPTGTVSFTWFTNGTCAGDGTSAGTVALVNGVADPSTAEGPLTPGSYSFDAVYNGDSNYTSSPISDCEPLSVFNAALTIGYWQNHMYKCAPNEKTGHNGCNNNGPFTDSFLGSSICNNLCVAGKLSTTFTATAGTALSVFNANNCSNAATSDSNAAACLAAQLLAAELNVANQANTCICATIGNAIDFLTAVGYSGPGTKPTFSGTNTRAAAIALKTRLDNYNNGTCPS